MSDGFLVYKSGTGIRAGSANAVSVTNAGTGLWDCVFAYVSRTADTERFLVQANTALGAAGFAYGTVTAIGVDTITIRVSTRDTLVDVGGTNRNNLIDLSFNVSFQELG